MKLRFHLPLWLCLALTGCDEAKKPKPAEPETTNARSGRPAREAPPDQRKNLRASFKTAADLATTEEREKAISEVAWNAVELDPELAREAFRKLETDSPGKLDLARHLAMRMAEENPDEALNWAATLDSEKAIAAARGQIALVISEKDPRRAADILSESGIAGRGFDVAAVQVLDRWAEQSPQDAAAWVVLFPQGKSREAGLKAIVSRWAEADSKAMFSWISTLRDGDVRNETARAVADALADQAPETREAWLRDADAKTRAEVEALTKSAPEK